MEGYMVRSSCDETDRSTDYLHNISDLRHKVEVISGMNGVAMARNGLIFSEDGATGPRKVFRYLWGLRDTKQNSKNTSKVKNKKNTDNYHIYIYIYIYITRCL